MIAASRVVENAPHRHPKEIFRTPIPIMKPDKQHSTLQFDRVRTEQNSFGISNIRLGYRTIIVLVWYPYGLNASVDVNRQEYESWLRIIHE